MAAAGAESSTGPTVPSIAASSPGPPSVSPPAPPAASCSGSSFRFLEEYWILYFVLLTSISKWRKYVMLIEN